MCDITTILTIGSTIIGAAGQLQQADASAKSSEYSAKVANMNAELSDRRAKDALARGEAEEQQKRQQVQQVMGQQRAALAANGVDLTFGSPLDTIVDTATLGELDALTIRQNTARESYDYRVQAVNQRAGSTMSTMEAANQRTAGYMGAAGTILGGAGKAYKDYKTTRIGAIGN